MKLYKLTDKNGRTKNGMQWSEGCTNFAMGEGTELCTNGVLHAYRSPLISVFLNPIHTDFTDPRLFLCEGEIVSRDNLKTGSKSLTCISEIDVPKPSTECRIAFAVLCALTVYEDPRWKLWAWNWLDGSDRTYSAARDAARAAARDAARYAARYAAGYAARYAARYAAGAAAGYAAGYAAYTNRAIDLEALADLAFRITADGM